ncbi:hypothetical protein WN944_009644 [Citrus x changshan-huyou]|uniref:Uncharacterized protein n=1 Tax=Citrus x changshan-huyou TaxID=2935761 RepID=A0AAP0QWG3_9ROSI
MAPKFSLVLSVTRQAPELIVPARPTPRELKQLSDIDDQESFRFPIPVIFLYKNNSASSPPVLKEKDPVKVIKEAISEALVYYYPFASRLIEGPNRKLMVDCNGEGILFLEAEGNFKLEQLGGAIQPPCPYLEQLIYNIPDSEGILGCPLLLIQRRLAATEQAERQSSTAYPSAWRSSSKPLVPRGAACTVDATISLPYTRILPVHNSVGVALNHNSFALVISIGIVHVLAIGILQIGGFKGRDDGVTRLMCGGFTLAIRFNHAMCDASGLMQFVKTMEKMARDTFITTNPNEMDHKSFYFGPNEVRVLKNQLPLHLRNCSTFGLLAACMWRCRTIAHQPDPKDTVQFSCLVNARAKNYKMDIPSGYYGNAVAFPAVHSKVGALCNNPLGYAVALVKKAKAEMGEEHIRSAADLMEVKGRRPRYAIKGNYIVSDLSKVGFDRIDLGWGKPVFAGIAGAKSIFSFLNRYQKEDGETGTLIPIRFPRPSMKI